MITQDYLVRMLADFAAAIMRSMMRATEQRDPRGSAVLLDAAVGKAVDMDGDVLLSLSPETISTVMQATGTDPNVTEFMARSLLLAASYYSDAGEQALCDLRRAQANAIARAYGHDLSDMGEPGASASSAASAMRGFVKEQNEARKLGLDL